MPRHGHKSRLEGIMQGDTRCYEKGIFKNIHHTLKNSASKFNNLLLIFKK
jgi:hypothetical protein